MTSLSSEDVWTRLLRWWNAHLAIGENTHHVVIRAAERRPEDDEVERP